MSDNGVRYIRTRKVLRNRNGYPYREAELIPFDQDTTKTWYIKYYIWDIGREKLVRRRVFKNEFASRPDLEDKLIFAQKAIDEINHLLRRGGYQETEEKETDVETFSFNGYKLLDAIEYVINLKLNIEKLAPGTIKEYRATKFVIGEFLKFIDQNNLRIKQVKKDFVNRFLHYLREERKAAEKTYNCRVGMMRSIINSLMNLDPHLFAANPFANVPFLKTVSKKHAAYTETQIVALKDSFLKAGELQLLLFMQFMFFSLARPNELRYLKIGHIDIVNRKIRIAGETAKTKIEEFIGINDRFAAIIEQSGILKYPGNYYVFSNKNKDHSPGETPVSINYFYKHIVEHIKRLKLRDINPNYDMYGFKHSGAISLYMATKDAYLVKQQCRHTTLEQTTTYLRDLGLFVNFQELNKWTGPI